MIESQSIPDPQSKDEQSDCGDLDLSGYSPAAREAIRRRLKEDPQAGPEAEAFERDVKRSAEELPDDQEGC